MRIPVTSDQKKLVTRAAELAGQDMAAWVRDLVLSAAVKQLADKRQKSTR